MIKAINDFLREVIENNHKCQHCIYCHGNTCFFAYDCIREDFRYFDKGYKNVD